MKYYVFVDAKGIVYAVTPENVTLEKLEIETNDPSQIDTLVQQQMKGDN